MSDAFFKLFTGGDSLPPCYHRSGGPRLSPAKPHTYLLDVGHDPSLGLNVQLFDSFNKLLFLLTLQRVTRVNGSILQARQPGLITAIATVSE